MNTRGCHTDTLINSIRYFTYGTDIEKAQDLSSYYEKIIEKNKDSIRIESQLGKSTKLTLTIPFSPLH